MEKKTNKEKLAIFKFLRKSVLSQGLLGYFLQNSYLRKTDDFREKCKKKKKKK